MVTTPLAGASPAVDLVSAVYAAFGRGDAAFILGKVAPDCLWDYNVGTSPVPWHQPARGSDGVAKFLEQMVRDVAITRFEPQKFIAAGGDVIAHIRLSYRVTSSGGQVDEEQLHWWTIDGGRVTRLRHFEDTAQVIAAWQGR